MKPLKYTESESERASEEWKASCGPHSIAAACGLTLDAVRPALVNYKGWMSPTQMSQALVRLGVPYTFKSRLKTSELCNGINRVQWEGKWLNPGVPARVAYFHTHYVAHFNGWVLCTATISYLWSPVEEWRHFQTIALKSPFHITHHWPIDPTP